MTELAQLARDVGVHERTLRRAVNDGTLRATRPTTRTLVLSLSERRYVRRRWRMVADLKAALRTEHNARFAMLFGSAATGSDTAASDVDVLVELRDSSLDRIIDLSSKLTAIVGRRVDLLRLEDVEADLSFLSNLLAEGRVLVDREERWGHLRQRERTLRRRGGRQQAKRTRDALAGIDRLLGA
jgi:predicted nucleotidyltransferase